MASTVSRRRAMRTPPRVTRTKPKISYAESSSSNDDDNDSESEQPASEEQSSRRATRSQATNSQPLQETRPIRAISIRDQQSKNSEAENQRSSKSSRSTTRSRSTRSHQSQKRSRRSSSDRVDYNDESDSRSPKKRKQSKRSSPTKIASHNVGEIQGSGVIPPWQSLPYHILVQIFQYATYPLYEEHTFQPLPSGRWLLSVARLCRDFAEPAFTVLYSSPPLVPMVLAHRLVDLLMADPLPMAFKYRQKVESLRIDVGQVVAYTLPGSGLLDLHGLIKDLPRLMDLEFYHQKDMSPYRNLDENVKWTYPDSIFEALEYINPTADPTRGDKTSICRLRSWRWSSRLGGKKYSIEQIPSMHLKPSFSSLQKVAFVNYQIPYLKKDEEDPEHEKVLAKAINALPNLKHLIFESSTLVNAKLLPLLPTGIRNLELINCWEIIASDFGAFLLTHGRHLRCLNLNHNQSLSLEFLPVLASGCPNLQVLRMNLHYFNLHVTYRDSEPLYEHLMTPEQIPLWPSTMQTIELIQLRKWENAAAEIFFQSLLDGAANLPDLRRLTIQAILNIGWRDRASFRDKWVGSLNRVFKRTSKSPKAIFSLPKALEALVLPPGAEKQTTSDDKAPMEAKQSLLGSNITHTSERSPVVEIPAPSLPHMSSNGSNLSPPARRSARSSARNLQSGKYVESSDSEQESEAKAGYEGSAPVSRAGSRSSRLERELGILKQTAGKQNSIISSTENSEDDSTLNGSDKGKGKANEFIQGMCEIVEVRIDNLRPTENQVTEADFLDEEMSGDDDWNGDDPADDGYAW